MTEASESSSKSAKLKSSSANVKSVSSVAVTVLSDAVGAVLSKVRVNAELAVPAFPAASVTFAVTEFEPVDSSPVGIVNSTKPLVVTSVESSVSVRGDANAEPSKSNSSESPTTAPLVPSGTLIRTPSASSAMLSGLSEF